MNVTRAAAWAGLASQPTRADFSRREFWLIALLIAATFATYLPALAGEFLLDDELHVTRPELRPLAGLARIWGELGATQQYYPVLHTAFWIEHRIWGDAVSGYHVTNVLLHATNALLLVAIMRRLLLPGGWLAAFLFALHPVCVESVAWISEQKNTLSTAFYLGALLASLRFDRQRRWPPYVLASLLALLAFLSKTATITLPAAILLIHWWRKSRLDWRQDVVPLLPWFGAALLAGLLTLRVERTLIDAIGAELPLNWIDRPLVASRALGFYFVKLVWPANLSFLYEPWTVPAAGPLPYLFPLLVAAVGAAHLFLARISRAPLAAFLLFSGTLLPVLGFADVEWFVFAFVADHFQYLASLAIIVPVAAVLAPAATRRDGRIAIVALLSALAVLTWRHSASFRDNVTLYARAAAVSPGSAVAHHHLGLALAKLSGRESEAVRAFEHALQINPSAAEVHENLGELLLRIPDRGVDGIAHLQTAIRMKPRLARLHKKLAFAYTKTPERLPDAITHYAEALRLEPADSPGRTALRQALAEAHYNFGNRLLAAPERLADAISHYEEAVRLDPSLAEAHSNLGGALARAGRLTEAIAHFEAALRLKPDFASARRNLEQARRALEMAR